MKERIGVIGAGVMGRGVAQRFAQYGFQVLLLDREEDVLNEAMSEIKRNIRFASMFQKGISEDCMSNIFTTLSYDDLKDVDYIIENVTEDSATKLLVYEQLEQVCKKECIYMVNTSCIPITEIAAKTNRAEQVIGVHFMNPVPMKDFSEVIRGYYTSEETIEKTRNLLNETGISIEVVNDSPGFVSNRVSHLFMNEAAYLVYEGVATAEQVDTIFKKAFGHKMGPLETADLIGLDTVLDSLRVLYEEYEDSKFRACPLLKKLVRAGLTGRKSGEGFYKY